MGFYAVAVGAYTLAADLNQYYTQLTGNAGVNLNLLAPSSTSYTILQQYPSAPTVDATPTTCGVVGDVYYRTGLLIRASGTGGFGGIFTSNGVGATTRKLYGSTTGWRTDDGLSVGNNVYLDNGTGMFSYKTMGGGGTQYFMVGATTGNDTWMGAPSGQAVAWVDGQTYSIWGSINNAGLTVPSMITANGTKIGTDSYSYLDGSLTLNFRVAGVHAMKLNPGNVFSYSGSNYACLIAGAQIVSVGTGNADIAEELHTQGTIHSGMAVCIVANETVAACPHHNCRIAKIVSTAPTQLLKAHAVPMNDTDHALVPLPDHETMRPLTLKGIVPVLTWGPIVLGDELTTAGPDHPGYLRAAAHGEHVIGDVVSVTAEEIKAWIY